jgi:large repetitive protein
MLREQHWQKKSAMVARLALSTLPKRFFRMLLAVSVLLTASLSLSAQTISVLPASLTFAKQAVGSTSAAKTVTITNNSASLQAVSISASGDFTESDNCGGNIAGGASCNMNVSVAPATMGDISGAVAIRDNSGNLLAFVVLNGTGSAPVTASPAILAFGSVPIGTLSAAKTFRITNDTSGSINVTAITGSSDYVIDTGSCLAAAIAPQKYCTVSVQVEPTAASDDGSIVITHNAQGGTPLAVALSATGSGIANPPLSLSGTSLTFKMAAGGISAVQNVTVANVSGSAVTMGAITASSDYSEINTCPASGSILAAGGSCTISIAFAPQFVGKLDGSVAVGYAGNNSPQLVNLSGTALPTLSVAPPSLKFGFQDVGSVSAAKTVKVTNNSESAVSLNSILASGDFQIQAKGTTCSLNDGALAGGEECIVKVQFAPTVGGPSIGSIWVANSGNPSPLRVALSGSLAYSETASASLTPSSAHQGSAETIVITGSGTNFAPGTTVSFGAGITTGTVTVNGPTSASVPIVISDTVATGPLTVTITTGAQVVTATFTVVAGIPAVSLISPNNIQPTQSENVAITGVFTNWTSGTTKANFGPGIAVGGAAAGAFGPVTVNSATSLTASLVTSGATNGLRAVQIQTGSQTLTVKNGIDVETCNGTAPIVVSISPANGVGNVPLNTQYQVQFSAPMNRNTFSLGSSGSTTIYFWDSTVNEGEIPATISLDASGTIATITPTEELPAGHLFYVYLSYANYVQDACGDNLGSVEYYFYTAFGPDTAGPTLTGTSPVNGDTNIPLSNGSSVSTPVVLQFNDQLDPITAQTGFSMTTGGNAVAGTFSYSAGDAIVTFTPASALTASTTYTVSYSAQITDDTGTPLNNPGSFSFTTGTAPDTTTPSVTIVDPPNSSGGVGLNVTPHVTFNEPVNELTIPTALYLYYGDSSVIVPATVTVSANRLSATVTPSAPLLPNTYYYLYLYNYTDIAGNGGYGGYVTNFYTGTSAVTSPVTVTTISPVNAQTGVPLNAQINAVTSNNIDPTTVTNSSITVTPSGGSAIAGTVMLAANGVGLTFVPTAALTTSTVYNVSVGGFKDIDGNAVTTFTSSFTTGTATYGSGSFSVVSFSPANGATGVSVTSPVTFTMTSLINPASVNDSTVYVYDQIPYEGDFIVAGSYTLSGTGTAVTFTPLTPYPASTVMQMCVYGLTDEAGNSDTQCSSFTTANTANTTPPTVTITPANGATNVGLNTAIVLVFSESINPYTVTANTLALFNGDTSIGYSHTISQDNRTIVLNYNGSTLPPGATLTIELSGGIQDLSGNGLAPTTSQFTLATELSSAAPQVLVMRPGNGATNVPVSTVVTLFTNTAMNVGTVAGALYVTDNGVVVSGTTQLSSNGQAIEFTPAASFNPGDGIQVFLGSTAQSADGVALSSFSGQFTVAGSPVNTSAAVQAVNPQYNAANVPVNTVLDIEYNQALLPVTVNNVNVTLEQNNTGVYQTVTPSLVGGGQVIQILPTSNLAANVQYRACVSGVTDIDGVPVANYCLYFTTGTAIDTAAPTVVSVAPPNGFTNIGTNAGVSVTFNKAINPVSVTGSTIQLSAGSTTETPSSISFSPDYARVSITPQAPLPPSTQMTIAINGLTSEAGTAVASQSTTFTTMAGPDFNPPYVVNSSVQNSQTNVPVNSAFTMTFNKPVDIGSLDGASVGVGSCCWTPLPATISWSADQTTVFIAPTTTLAAGTQYYLFSFNLTDLSGNPQSGFDVSFTTSFSANTNPPTVINTSPENADTQIPTNSPVEVLFSEPIQPTSVGQVTLTKGGNPVAVTASFGNGNQLLILTPTVPLVANTSYTLTIAGVKGTAGNQMTSTVTNTFTTGPTFNFQTPTVMLVDPANGTLNVGVNVTPHVEFSEAVNELTIPTALVLFYQDYYQGYATIASTVTVAANRLSATITPSAALQPNTQYEVYLCGFTDIAGNGGSCFTSTFWTGTSTDTTHATVSTISPAKTQTGVPLNADVVAVMSATIDPTSITNSSITVTPSGGSAIAGTVSLAADGVTLTFVPAAALTASKLYNVSVGGFNDVGGNTVTTFTSSFTTGTATYGSGSFNVVSTSPATGATGVSVTSPVTITMSNLIDAGSVNPNTVFVYVYSSSQVVAGTYSVSGNAVTFTPLTQYPANTQMAMGVSGLTDEAGNTDAQYPYTFTTTNTVDKTAPTVTISPANGATNVGLNTQVVLTFSKSINPGTITRSTVSLLNGDAAVNYGYSVSRDNRTLVLNPSAGQLPSGATITVALTNGVQDLSGNALAPTTSQFTLTTALSGGAPSVVVMRPGNGATNVPVNTVVTLFTNAALNASTVTGALNVTDNGVVVTGTVQVNGNGQAIEFTPAAAFNPGDLIRVFLGPGAQSTDGVGVSSFGGQFTVAGSPVNTSAAVQAVNPLYGATNVPVNTVLDIEYNQVLLPVTVNNVNVTLRPYNSGVYQTVTPSLVGGGQVIQILPTTNLAANVTYYACVSGVTDIDGVPVQNYCLYFTTGTAIDLAGPTIVSVAPPNGFTNIGTNAGVSVTFNKAINPVSVTGSTIRLSAGATTETPSSISFSADYARVSITPQAPLPPSTQMTVAINGVTSEAGIAVTSQSTTFTTMAGPDFNAPYVVNSSVQNSQTVGTNAAFAMQFSEPIDEGSLDGATIGVGSCCWTPLPATISWSADQTTVFITPTSPLAASAQYYLFSFGLTDLAGNPQSGFDAYFNTGTGADTTGPVVQQVSPPSGATGIPINAPVDVLFNEPISGASITGVTLKQGGTVVSTTTSLYDGDQGVQLTPLVPLATGTTYSINVTGVVDITGNAQSPFSSVSFTTGAGVDLTVPTIASTNPTNGQANVPDNTTCQVVFSEPMDPAYFDPNTSLTLRTSSNVVVPATITFSANYTTATLTPTSALTGGGATYYFEIGYNPPYLYDLGGNQFPGTYITFTTH